MVLSKLFMSAKYTKFHLVGCLVCIAGITTTLVNDSDSNQKNSSLKGDMICMVGSALFGCSDVLQESIVKEFTRKELLSMLGIFGTIFALIQFLAFEFNSLRNDFEMTSSVAFYIALYILSSLLLKIFLAALLQENDSVMLNLSLLTSNIYGALFSYFVEKHPLKALYFISFTIVLR
mmetsp:Transcript_15544/g.23153  ORF Transcript_15544/g.23153 Transcript_15544/m.23153 type:complete len:177 (+) Transcript_15544:347-877(+)